jgi:chitodextrinase
VYFALASADRGRCIGDWRADASRYVIVAGDAPPHDPEPVTGFTMPICKAEWGAGFRGWNPDWDEQFPCSSAPFSPVVILGEASEEQQAPSSSPRRVEPTPLGIEAGEVDTETEERLRLYQEWLRTVPPQWRSDSWVAADRVEPTAVWLRWSEATGDASGRTVTSYHVYLGSDEVLSTSGTVRSGRVTGLSPGTRYRIRVQAADELGNRSVDGPTLEVTTPTAGAIVDSEPPAWVGAELVALDITSGSVQLRWRGAVDAGSGVARYRILSGGAVVEEVEAPTDSVRLTGLAAGSDYTFKVEAGDSLGHWSSNGPSVSVRTNLSPETAVPATIFSISIGDFAGTELREIAEFTFGGSVNAPDAGSVVNAILESLRTITDTTPPVLRVPREIVVHTADPNGAVVVYSVEAWDDSDPSPVVSCVPASGSLFPVGLTMVHCTARDSSENVVEASFPVRVQRRSVTAPVMSLWSSLGLVAAVFALGLWRLLRAGR